MTPKTKPTPSSQPFPRYYMMSALVDAEPLSAQDFADILKKHHKFIASGGGGGDWQTVVTPGGYETGIVMGIYRPMQQPSNGEQANLEHKRLTGLDLRNVSLPYANLCGVFCQEQDLSGADLHGSLFTDADLSRAKLRGAKLIGADFSRSEMAGCDLRDADLSSADFEYADLSGADLSGANLNRAKLVKARLDRATLDAVPLLWQAARDGDLHGVETALHLGAKVNARGEYGDTALNLAAEHGHAEVAAHLLEVGAEIENQGGADKTPLMCAAFAGHVDVVQLLLEKGALISRDLLSSLQLKVNILFENAEEGMVNPEAAEAWGQFLEYMIDVWKKQNQME